MEDLGIVIQIMGSTGGAALMFILPGLSYLFHFPAVDGDEHGAPVDSVIAKNLYAGVGYQYVILAILYKKQLEGLEACIKGCISLLLCLRVSFWSSRHALSSTCLDLIHIYQDNQPTHLTSHHFTSSCLSNPLPLLSLQIPEQGRQQPGGPHAAQGGGSRGGRRGAEARHEDAGSAAGDGGSTERYVHDLICLHARLYAGMYALM